MRGSIYGFFVVAALALPVARAAQWGSPTHDGRAGNLQAEAGQIFALANQARRRRGWGSCSGIRRWRLQHCNIASAWLQKGRSRIGMAARRT